MVDVVYSCAMGLSTLHKNTGDHLRQCRPGRRSFRLTLVAKYTKTTFVAYFSRFSGEKDNSTFECCCCHESTQPILTNDGGYHYVRLVSIVVNPTHPAIANNYLDIILSKSFSRTWLSALAALVTRNPPSREPAKLPEPMSIPD